MPGTRVALVALAAAAIVAATAPIALSSNRAAARGASTQVHAARTAQLGVLARVLRSATAADDLMCAVGRGETSSVGRVGIAAFMNQKNF